MKRFTQISYEEMVQIETLLWLWWNPCEIGLHIWRNKTSIYRTILNNSNDDWIFKATIAWNKIMERKHISNSHPRILSDSFLEEFILEKIQSYWSPEQVAWKWKRDTWESLSHETIYQYIYDNKPEMIQLYFRRKWKKYQHNKKDKYQIMDRKMIDERPKEVETRNNIWHWEWDTVIWKNHKQAIVTNVERKSWFLLAAKVEKRTAENIFESTTELFSDIPEEFRISITYDNWREFAWHSLIEWTTKMTVYFAHAYSPWERWSNENTNWLLRQYIPKWSDFTKVTQEEINHYVELLNNRPRKRLWYLTPYEVWQNELKSCNWL